MSDDADLAFDVEALRIKTLLLNRNKDTLPFTGLCHNCLEVLSVGLFCDADCRDDYEKRQYFRR